jgi:glutamate racemase
MSDNRSIGVFDSGVGGLTVLKSLMDILPRENIIYFGDIARIPYGTKSQATIQKFAAETVRFLIQKDVKAIIIACNTISAVAKDIVKEIAGEIPVIDVISTGVSSVADNLNIGVIATPATINSNAYTDQINQLYPKSKVFTQACGLFVSMIEEGFVDGEIVELIAKEYLGYFKDKSLDCLILGCTHYPMIKDSITKVLKNVTLIDPSQQAVKILMQLLTSQRILNDGVCSSPKYKFYVTDIPLKFQLVGEIFLHAKMTDLEMVSLDD